MSSCIKDFYDFDLVKKCCRCGILSLKSIFIKIKRIEMVLDLSVKIVARNILRSIIKIIKIEY